MKNCIRTLALIAVALLPVQAAAEDIDLFLSTPPNGASDVPNVLILLDNTANWNSAFSSEKDALVRVFDGLDLDKFRVGVMMFGQPGVGYVRAAIRTMDATNRPLYSDMVASMTVSGDRSSARTLSRTVSEAYRYLQGLGSVEPTVMVNNDFRDYAGNTAGSTASNLIYALPDNALASSSVTETYNSPLSAISCADTYIIYIGNNVSGGNVTEDNTSRNAEAGAELAAAGGDTTTIPLVNYTSHQSNYADEWARFMHLDMGVRFYTVDVNPTPMPGGHSRGMGNSKLIESMATVSQGKYFRVDSSTNGGAEIDAALNTIFSEIQSVNSVFASVALPAASNSQSTFLNQVFIGMFRPDEFAFPRWPGNLKQYKLGIESNTLKLLDADDTSVLNSGTGFIGECARSYWTPTTADTYWAFDPRGECSAAANLDISNSPDGPIVEKGAAAYARRSNTTRTLYTCADSFASCTTLTQFNTANTGITEAALGVPGFPAGRTALINWARGADLSDENGNGVTAEPRPSIHGDVVHSRPVAVNYSSDPNNPAVVVYYSGNDGVLRAINGNRSDAQVDGATTVPAGHELWGFLPPEFYPNIRRLAGNTERVKFPASGANAGATGAAKPYGVDGPLTALDGEVAGVSKKFLYAGMRRTGRMLYAFDITDRFTPTLKWKKGCPNLTDDVDCTTGYTGLGQTWSTPIVTYADGYNTGGGTPVNKPLLLMGGGYDACEDSDDDSTINHSCTATSKGRIIYVMDADTGTILKTFTTDRPVVGELTVVPVSPTDSAIVYAYAADTGGNIYRISGGTAGTPAAVGTTVPGSWIMIKIASLGCDSRADSTCTANRKFLFPPDVVSIPGTDRYGLLIGSGDREKPIVAYGATNTVQNYFFSIIDEPTDSTWLNDDGSCGANRICLAALTTLPSVFSTSTSIADFGFAYPLATGEQVVTATITANDVANFSTHIAEDPNIPPDPNDPASYCTNKLGTATAYNVDYENGEANKINLIGGGLAPSPVAGKVVLDDGTIVPFCIGCGGENSTIGGGQIGVGITWTQPTGRVYWNIQK